VWAKKPFVIALAGWHCAGDQRRSLEAGIDLHLVKPVDPDALQRLLRRFKAIIER
jgi:CheY-like chemotaxis protein